MLRNYDTPEQPTLNESKNFFLWTGLILLFGFLRGILQNALMMIIPVNGQVISLISYAGSFLGILEMFGILIVCIVFRGKAFRAGETIGRKLCGLWTLLLFIGYVISLLLPRIILMIMGSAMNGSTAYLAVLQPHLFRCLLIAIGLFISGIFLNKIVWKLFSIPVLLLIPLTIILSRFTVEIPLNGDQMTMTFTPAAMILTALPAVVMLIIRTAANRE